MAEPQTYEVAIDKLVHGGQGIGTLADGKKALVWNVLPGERVRFTARKSKSSYIEGIADEIMTPSAEREKPRDDLYLSTSPWQMMKYASENKYKQEILAETLQRAAVEYDGQIPFAAPEDPWLYRNKMEYSFWGDDDGLHLALYNRGTHLKQSVNGSSIARPEIDWTAQTVRDILNKKKVRAGDLKSLMVRCNAAGDTVAALFVKTENFSEFKELEKVCNGLVVYFSTPKSPASVITKELYSYGSIILEDPILGNPISYDVVSFFQVNLIPYEMALEAIKTSVEGLEVTDMYSGVGSIGLSVAQRSPRLVELDSHSVKMAKKNVFHSSFSDVEVVHAASEKALDYIPSGDGEAVIFDPPRAGLHADVTARTLENLPEQIVYLSCNPSTFARDLQLLQEKYSIESVAGYNFFPRTPHIEALAILKRK